MRRTVGTVAMTALLAFATPVALATGVSATKSPKGGGGGHKSSGTTSSISLVLLESTDGLAHYDQTVTFNISTTATDQPWVNLKCYQSGSLVAEGWDGYFDGSLSGRNFTLASPSWTGGAADCTATLTTPQWAPLASTSFHVYP